MIEITRQTTGQLSDAKSSTSSRRLDEGSANAGRGLVQSSPQDVVSLTDTALRLRQIEDQLRTVPVVDNARVTEVRNALNSGNYEIDAARVAEKIIEFESRL